MCHFYWDEIFSRFVQPARTVTGNDEFLDLEIRYFRMSAVCYLEGGEIYFKISRKRICYELDCCMDGTGRSKSSPNVPFLFLAFARTIQRQCIVGSVWQED